MGKSLLDGAYCPPCSCGPGTKDIVRALKGAAADFDKKADELAVLRLKSSEFSTRDAISSLKGNVTAYPGSTERPG